MTKTKETAAEKAARESAERTAAINEADAEFREDVAKAAAKRDKAIAKFKSPNVAEQAWNETKSESDPDYNAVSGDFRQKLDNVVQSVKETGNADVVGLEEFEKRVVELLAEQGVPAGSAGALVPADMPGRPAEATEPAEKPEPIKKAVTAKK